MARNWKQMTANVMVLVSLAGQSAFAGGNKGSQGGQKQGPSQNQGTRGGAQVARPSVRVQPSVSGGNGGGSFKGLPAKVSVPQRTINPVSSFKPPMTVLPVGGLPVNRLSSAGRLDAKTDSLAKYLARPPVHSLPVGPIIRPIPPTGPNSPALLIGRLPPSTPIVGGGNLNRIPNGNPLLVLNPSPVTDIRQRIGDRNLGGNLNLNPVNGNSPVPPAAGNGIGNAGNVRVRVPGDKAVGLPDVISPPNRNARPNPGNPGNDENGTIAEELEPINDVTPPANPPADASEGHQGGSDLSSIIDAVSGLVGSGSGSSPSSGGGDAGSAPPADSGSVESPGAESVATTTAEPVVPAEGQELDIELTDVRLVDAGNLEQKTGPRFRLTYRNKGAVEVPKFHVTVAVDAGDTLTETAEIVTVEAVGLKPGKSQMVDVRLPVEVLKMTTDKSGKTTPFALLVAVLDSDESLDETNEENNVMVLARQEIKPIEKSGTVKK